MAEERGLLGQKLFSLVVGAQHLVVVVLLALEANNDLGPLFVDV